MSTKHTSYRANPNYYYDAGGALGLGNALGNMFNAYEADMHERDVANRSAEILKATQSAGGDISAIDPSLYEDTIGLEAFGRVSQQQAQNMDWAMKNMRMNRQILADNYKVTSQYLSDLDSAAQSGDQQKYINTLAMIGNRSSIPFRATATPDGMLKLERVTPDGYVDAGSMSLLDASKMVRDFLGSEDRYMQGSMAYMMQMQEDNKAMLADASKWRMGVGQDGKTYNLIPQVFERDGNTVPGFLVGGAGQRPKNMTFEELSLAGIQVAAGGGAFGMKGGIKLPGQGGAYELTKDDRSVLDGLATVPDPITGERNVDPVIQGALYTVGMQLGGFAPAMNYFRQMQREFEAADQNFAALPPEQKLRVVSEYIATQGGAITRPSAGAPAPQQSAPQQQPVKADPRAEAVFGRSGSEKKGKAEERGSGFSKVAPKTAAPQKGLGIDPEQIALAGEEAAAVVAETTPRKSNPRTMVRGPKPRGLVRAGNIDLDNRPIVPMADGSKATVLSFSFSPDGYHHILIPQVTKDGRVLSQEEAIRYYEATGDHLGVFDSPESATAYAKALSAEQGKDYHITGSGHGLSVSGKLK